MKMIPLTQGKFAMVDDEDYERLNQFKWGALQKEHTWYAKRESKDPTTGKSGKLSLHQAVLETRQMIDHKDGNGLNNQRSNLRPCTPSGNMGNRKKWQTSLSSRFKGVFWCKYCNAWLAKAGGNGMKRYIGRFSNEIEAAHAYDKRAREIWGEFARLNFPDALHPAAARP